MYDAPDQPVGRGRRRGAAPPARRGVPDDRAAQRAPVRGAEPRPADRPLPAGLQGRRGVRARSPPSSGPVAAAAPGDAATLAGSASHDRQGRTAAAPRSGAGSRRSSRSGTRNAAAIVEVPLARVTPNPYQPRRHMDDAGLEELAASIREHGVLQPVLVTETLDGYQLIAGERRVRAARLAGPRADPRARPPARGPRPARGRARRERPARGPRPDRRGARLPPADRRVRADPGARRRARRQGAGDASRTRCGCSTSTRTSRRPSPTGGSREGHGRALGGLAASTARPTCSARCSARACRCARPRSWCAGCASRASRRAPAAARRRLDPDLERVEEDLRQRLGTKVSLSRSRKGGRIVIEYYSDEELGRLYERLIGGTA